MLVILLSLIVPTLVYLAAPRIVSSLGHPAKHSALLSAACFVYFISWYIPSFPVDGRNTAFVTHFIGGGIFSGMLWLYFKKNLGWKLSPTLELFTLYALVSALGVANELFEFAAFETGIRFVSGFDTWWDLFANTLGALAFWTGYRLSRRK